MFSPAIHVHLFFSSSLLSLAYNGCFFLWLFLKTFSSPTTLFPHQHNIRRTPQTKKRLPIGLLLLQRLSKISLEKPSSGVQSNQKSHQQFHRDLPNPTTSYVQKQARHHQNDTNDDGCCCCRCCDWNCSRHLHNCFQGHY